MHCIHFPSVDIYLRGRVPFLKSSFKILKGSDLGLFDRGRGCHRRKATEKFKKKHLAFFQLATARIKFKSLKISISIFKTKILINERQ